MEKKKLLDNPTTPERLLIQKEDLKNQLLGQSHRMEQESFDVSCEEDKQVMNKVVHPIFWHAEPGQ